MSKQIPLTQGKFAIVDDEDYEWLTQYKWYTTKHPNTFYAQRSTSRKLGKKNILMHRQILGLEIGDPRETDHINHNGLNNKRSNLRICSSQQNDFNRKKVKGSSQFKGVSWDKVNKKWLAKIDINGKRVFIGRYNNEVEAAKFYDKKAKEIFGEFAYRNFKTQVQKM